MWMYSNVGRLIGITSQRCFAGMQREPLYPVDSKIPSSDSIASCNHQDIDRDACCGRFQQRELYGGP